MLCSSWILSEEKSQLKADWKWRETVDQSVYKSKPRAPSSGYRRPAAAQRPLQDPRPPLRGEPARPSLKRALTPAPEAGRGALFMSAWNKKPAVAEKIYGDFISNEWLLRATHFRTAVIVKRELATKLLSALPGCSEGCRNQRCLSARLPWQRFEPAQCMKESQNLRGTHSRQEHLPHSHVCRDGFWPQVYTAITA